MRAAYVVFCMPDGDMLSLTRRAIGVVLSEDLAQSWVANARAVDADGSAYCYMEFPVMETLPFCAEDLRRGIVREHWAA